MLPRPAPLKIDPVEMRRLRNQLDWILAGCALLMAAGLWWGWSIAA